MGSLLYKIPNLRSRITPFFITDLAGSLGNLLTWIQRCGGWSKRWHAQRIWPWRWKLSCGRQERRHQQPWQKGRRGDMTGEEEDRGRDRRPCWISPYPFCVCSSNCRESAKTNPFSEWLYLYSIQSMYILYSIKSISIHSIYYCIKIHSIIVNT